MRRMKFIMTFLLVFMTGTSRAYNYFSVETSGSITPGSQAEIIVNGNFDNDNITLYQFDLYLPDGVTLSNGEDGNTAIGTTYVLSNRHNGHSISVKERDEGFIRFIVFSDNRNTIESGSGELLRLIVDVAANLEGTLWGSIRNSMLFEDNTSKHTVEDTEFAMNIQNPLIDVTFLDITPNRLTLTDIGNSKQLSATIEPENATYQIVSWTSDDESVATVDESGYVTATGYGTTLIWVTIQNGSYQYSASSSVTVVIPSTSITLNNSELYFTIENETQELQATIEPYNASNQNLYWWSDDESIATVDQNGNVTAIGNGYCNIWVSTQDGTNLSTTCSVHVNIDYAVYATGISLNTDNLQFSSEGQTQSLYATITPTNASNQNVYWWSDNESIATVDPNGNVTAVSNGQCTIYAQTLDGTSISASCPLTVAILTTGVTLNQSDLFFTTENETQKLQANIQPYNASNQNLYWWSDDESIATVDQNGNVTAVNNGQCTIYASTQDGTNHTASCTIWVNIEFTVYATGISLNTDNLHFYSEGQTQSLYATITPNNASNQSLRWWSNHQEIATVDENGNVTAIGHGQCTIYAQTLDGTSISDSCSVTVDFEITRIFLGFTEIELTHLGETRTVNAFISPSNATNQSLYWWSDREDIATVDQDGNITAVDNGKAIITAVTQDGSGLSASCTVNVTIYPQSLKLDQNALVLQYEDVSYQLIANHWPSNTASQYKNTKWTSSDESVVLVTDGGTVTPVGNGTAEIKVETLGDYFYFYDICAVTVNFIATNITLNQDHVYFHPENDVQHLSATIYPRNAANQSVYWWSDDESIATVDQNGNVTAIGNGQCSIYASTQDGTNLSASCSVTVDFSITRTFILNCKRGYVGYNDDEGYLCGGSTLDFAHEFAIIKYEDSNYLYDVTKKAFVIHSTAGTAEVTGNQLQLSSTDFSKAVTGLVWGETGFDNYPWYLEDCYGNWLNMDNDRFVYMNTWKDFEEGEGGNTYQMEIVNGNLDVIEAIHLLDNYFHPIQVEGITLNQNELYFHSENEVQQLYVSIYPSNATNQGVDWWSDNEEIATVDENGNVTAISSGQCFITATTQDGTEKTASCMVTVTIDYTVFATGISINPTELKLTTEGETVQLTAIVEPANTSNKSVTWTSNDNGVATVDEQGFVTAVANGTTTITVITNDGTGLTATCSVTVEIAEEPEPQPTPHLINDVSELSNTKLFYIRTKENLRGALGVVNGKLGSTNPDSAENDCYCEQETPFAILQYDGAYYLYSTTDRMFITNTGRETNEPGQEGTHAVTVTKNTNGFFMFNFSATGNVINVSMTIDINTWGQTEDKWDEGNQFTIEEAGDFDPTEALAMFGAIVLEPIEAYYQAALNAIDTNGQPYHISTIYNGTRYYLNQQGYLTDTATDDCIHTFTRTEDSELFCNPGWQLAANFTNPQLTNEDKGDIVHNGHLMTDSQARITWEGQVWYLASNGFYAVRATNANATTWGADAFWNVMDNNGDNLPEADYSFDAAFVWLLEEVVPEQPVTVTANNVTMTYGANVPALTFTTEGAELQGKPEITTTATAQSPVGTYPITVTQGTVTNGKVTFVDGTLTITPATLTVGVKDVKVEQGMDIPAFTLTYKGFRNGDTEATAFTKKPTAKTTAKKGSTAGTYPITISGGEAKNYNIEYIEGTLTITVPDGIRAIENGALNIDHDVYDLTGRKMSKGKLPRGIYIINGRKMSVK